MNDWWKKMRRRLFGPTARDLRVNGWRHAVRCINEGRAAVAFLEMQLDANEWCGDADAFDQGARDALKRFKPWLP